MMGSCQVVQVRVPKAHGDIELQDTEVERLDLEAMSDESGFCQSACLQLVGEIMGNLSESI